MINLPAKPMTFESLPFVYRPSIEINDDKWFDWNVPPTDDYGRACEDGRKYAAYLAQYLKKKTQLVGSNVLKGIVTDMDFSDNSGQGLLGWLLCSP